MNKTLLHTQFNIINMIQIIKHGKNNFPICRIITQHLLDIIEVATCKLEILVKLNKEIDLLIADNTAVDNILSLEKLCARSNELYQEIENLPIMKEDADVLSEILIFKKLGSKYSNLLSLIYSNSEYISARSNPFLDTSHLHIR